MIDSNSGRMPRNARQLMCRIELRHQHRLMEAREILTHWSAVIPPIRNRWRDGHSRGQGPWISATDVRFWLSVCCAADRILKRLQYQHHFAAILQPVCFKISFLSVLCLRTSATFLSQIRDGSWNHGGSEFAGGYGVRSPPVPLSRSVWRYTGPDTWCEPAACAVVSHLALRPGKLSSSLQYRRRQAGTEIDQNLEM